MNHIGITEEEGKRCHAAEECECPNDYTPQISSTKSRNLHLRHGIGSLQKKELDPIALALEKNLSEFVQTASVSNPFSKQCISPIRASETSSTSPESAKSYRVNSSSEFESAKALKVDDLQTSTATNSKDICVGLTGQCPISITAIPNVSLESAVKNELSQSMAFLMSHDGIETLTNKPNSSFLSTTNKKNPQAANYCMRYSRPRPHEDSPASSRDSALKLRELDIHAGIPRRPIWLRRPNIYRVSSHFQNDHPKFKKSEDCFFEILSVPIGTSVRILAIPNIVMINGSHEKYISAVVMYSTADGMHKLGTRQGIISKLFFRDELLPTSKRLLELKDVPNMNINLIEASQYSYIMTSNCLN